VLAALSPAMQLLAEGGFLDGVWVGNWQHAVRAEPAEIVIEAFACNPPEAYVISMAGRERPPAWINLEYLSAEPWVEGSHLLPSKHPQLGLIKYFYFPGFGAATGGLLKEARLDAERQQFQADREAQSAFWQSCGAPAPRDNAVCISLFAYENAALPALLDAWTHNPRPIHCMVPVGKSLPAIAAWCDQSHLQSGSVVERGQLQLAVLPFLSQLEYDRLLWACDINFVRGEDSFVRAQWAQRPFVWHIYPQQDDAHRVKLDAFLTKFEQGLSVSAQQAQRDFWDAWEGQDAGPQGVSACWPALYAHLPALRQHGAEWAERMAAHGDLAARLLIFCQDLLE